MPDYNFRIARPEDISGLFKVMEAVGYIAAFFGDKSEKEATPALLGFLFAPESNVTAVVCETRGEIIAYCLFGPYVQYIKPGFPADDENFAYCLGFGVLNKLQGAGLGTRILLEAEVYAEKLGYKGMYTDVASTNRSSLKVQEKAGYERVGEFPDKHRPKGVKSILFRKVF